ncbi:MAG: ribosome-associated translation inhibitor RaiA [Chitinivibrionales bacterium]|nr:ribosome-associated translation inhibitor RaiA [Chitinivibrionales bacterium]MBD3357501.1 ribosome-associated translation inhibitor RaiA [Chitinivibrionales bacterium]
MNIQITARHRRASQSLKDTITEDLLRLEKFSEKITSCHAIIDNESELKTMEVNLTARGVVLTAKAKAENLPKAEALVIDKLERQLKKLNEKVKNHKVSKEKIENAEFVESPIDEV